MRRRLIALACATAISCAALPALAAWKEPCPALTEGVADKKFKPGQVWSYTTRPGEPSSTLIILRVDSQVKLGTIVHVRVEGLQAHNPRGELVPVVEHMPFSRDAMLASVDRLLRSNQPLPTLEGLQRWQADCGGIYTISVSRAVDVMEKTLNRP
jgi:hypothetical protein